jgi:hypothetical protein
MASFFVNNAVRVRQALRSAALSMIAFGSFGMTTAANATVFTFGFDGPTSGIDGTDANERVFIATSGTKTLAVRATAWSISGGKTYDSFLGLFGGGLGATSGDDETGDKNRHTIDNQIRVDFIVLQFNAQVELDSAVFNAFKLNTLNSSGSVTNSLNGYKDNDANIGVGNSASSWTVAPNLDNQNVSVLNSLVPTQFFSAGMGSSAVRTINPSNISGNVWIIGAALPANFDGKYDSFKFDLLTVSTIAPVPELSTWAMMILGFGMIGSAVRRKRVLQSVATA